MARRRPNKDVVLASPAKSQTSIKDWQFQDIKKPLLQIEWLDHHADGSWTQTVDHTPAICYSVGWLIKEDRKAITIAGSYSENPTSIGNTQYILKNCITKRRKISPP